MNTAALHIETGKTLSVSSREATALAKQAEVHDGTAPLSEQFLLRLHQPHQSTWQVSAQIPDANSATGALLLVGYGQLDLKSGAAEMVVKPQARRRRVGSRILDELRAAAHNHNLSLRVWAHGNIPATQRFAQSNELVVHRELLRMELDSVPFAALPTTSLTLPPGVRRFVRGKDEDALVAINAAAFAQHPEQGNLSREDFEERANEPWFRADGIFLDDPGHPRGFAWTKITSELSSATANVETPAHHVGELYVLGVSPTAQGHGVGSQLTTVALHYLAAEQVQRIELYVEGDNTFALQTYRRAGFTVAATDVQYG